MDTIVTARIPVEIKDQANIVLKEIGATPTELINAAYKYVLSNKALPEHKKPSLGKRRTLSKQQRELLRESIDKTSFSVSEEFWEGKSYKEIISEGRHADYESLS